MALFMVGGPVGASEDVIDVPDSLNHGTLSLGSGPFDGLTTGFFVNTVPTRLAFNLDSGSGADFINAQKAGVSKARLDSAGNLTLAGSVSATGGASLSAANTWTNPKTIFSSAPAASANYGVVNVGDGAFDGTTTGYYAGASAGTYFAINAASGYTGNLLDAQLAGVSKLSVTKDGLVNASSSTASHFGGVATASKAGTPSDADFTAAPPVGTIIVDTSANKIWVRTASATWKYAALT